MFASGLHADIKPLLEVIGAGVAVHTRDAQGEFRLVSANSRYCRICRCVVEESVGKTLAEIFPAEVARVLTASMAASLDEETAIESELALGEDGGSTWWRLLLSPVLDSRQPASRVIATCIDVSAGRRLENDLEISRRRYAALVNSAYDGIISIDAGQRIVLINETARRLFGVGDEILGQPLETLLPDRFRAAHAHHVEAFKESSVASRPMHARAPVVGRRRDGSEFPLEATIAKIRLGEATEMTAVLHDISERTRLVEELRLAATTDPLTGVANRRRLDQVVKTEFQRCERFGHTLALLIIDIDHFKKINDRFGHSAGDLALQSVVGRIRPVLRDIDTLGRWGGEEFVVLLPQTAAAAAIACAERIRLAVAEGGHRLGADFEIPITVSIGASASQGRADSVEKAFQRADAALYRAKRDGRNRVET